MIFVVHIIVQTHIGQFEIVMSKYSRKVASFSFFYAFGTKTLKVAFN